MENIERINGSVLFDWFRLGAKEVGVAKLYLNDINVFPIPDGDTGTNLMLTLKAMVEKTSFTAKFSDMIKNISECGLMHARGNSGILFASYVNGLAKESHGVDSVCIKEFSFIAHKAVGHMYQAIDNPVEGTMISVIKDWADFLRNNHHKYMSFHTFLTDAFYTAARSLDRTKTQLEVLKKHKVVDSGAAGFVRFLEGINRFFSTDASHASQGSGLGASKDPKEEKEEKIMNRYCTELTLTLLSSVKETDIEPTVEKIKDIIKKHGDSVVVASVDRKVKVHIHTNVPAAVIAEIKKFGEIGDQKVDDMKLQSIVNKKERTIGLLTDSICDLPDEIKLHHGIHTLPLGLIMDELVYLDKYTIDLPHLFEAIDNATTYPTSSQPEPSRIREFLESVIDRYDSLIFIAVASQLSGTYQAIMQEVKNLENQDKKITVIDSKLNSGAQGLLVKTAADLIKAGKSHDEVVEHVQKMIPKTKILVCLNTIEYAARGGRVSNTVGKVGMALGLRPIMTLDGEGKGATFGLAFSQKGITRIITQCVKKMMKNTGVESYSIVHADNEALAEEYAESFEKLIGKKPAFISDISSIVAINSGPGSVAICLEQA